MDVFARMAQPRRSAKILNAAHVTPSRDIDAEIRAHIFGTQLNDPFVRAARPVRSASILNPCTTGAQRDPARELGK